MTAEARARAQRLAAAVIGLSVVWLTVLLLSRANPVDTAVALLVVLVEILAVAVLSGPVLAVAVALAAVVLVNWYLVPPYGTFLVASPENVVALVVFALVAAVAAVLVEWGARSRARAEAADRQADLLADLVVVGEEDDAGDALERIRRSLGLDSVELLAVRPPHADVVLVVAGSAGSGPVSLSVDLPDGYRMVGRGTELFAPDPEFLASLGGAAVLAYERDRLRLQERRADELAVIDRARTALLASVGHDLRTPLTALRVSVDALSGPGQDLSEGDRAALLATVGSSVDRLDELITNLLDMSRLQAEAVLVQRRPTDVAEVVAGVLVAMGDGTRVRVDLPADLPLVDADPILLERVVANLVSNALRYSPSDAMVDVSGADEGGGVVLRVRDHGPGIPQEERDTAFVPFRRVGERADGGSGLGLAIVKGFAEAMDVDVLLGDAEGGGLVVSLTMRPWQGTP